jgi:hypothetical protein
MMMIHAALSVTASGETTARDISNQRKAASPSERSGSLAIFARMRSRSC